MDKKKWYLPILVLPALLGSILLLTVACEEPGIDQPIEPGEGEPMLPEPEEGPGEDEVPGLD